MLSIKRFSVYVLQVAGVKCRKHAWKKSEKESSDMSEAEKMQATVEYLLEDVGRGAETCVVLLHEDYALELPVFGPCASELSKDVKHVVFFLGAVRLLSLGLVNF